MFFSIIIPTLNSCLTLERCLSSIYAQRFQEFEVLIVDGGSNDATLQIVSGFQDQGFKQLSIFQIKDSGVYDAMNQGIKLSNGKWIYFLGSDDWLFDKEVLVSVQRQLETTYFSVAYGNVLIHGDSKWAKDQEIYAGKFNSLRLTKKNICHQALFYRNSFLRNINLCFDLDYPINADWDFNLKCIKKTDFYYLDLIIANFSSGGLSTKSKTEDPFFFEVQHKYPELFPSKLRILLSKIKKLISL